MPENDALKTYQFPKGKGLFTTFEDGDEFKVRVLTTDPVVSETEFTAPNGEINLSTKFAFIIWNFTLDKAQILNAGAQIAKAIQKFHQDEDFGANIKQVDLKISAEGSNLSRKYTVTVLPKAEVLTNEQIKACQAIDLDEKVENGQRMSFYKPDVPVIKVEEPAHTPGVADADPESVEDIIDSGEPINLDGIPF